MCRVAAVGSIFLEIGGLSRYLMHAEALLDGVNTSKTFVSMTYHFLPGWTLTCTIRSRNGVYMEKMFVSLEGSNIEPAESALAAGEPVRSTAAIASHRCKLYRAQLDQAIARRQSATVLANKVFKFRDDSVVEQQVSLAV
jgi:hypothetical protein